jgi:glycosyltransferase involved in cell wall biosynthesis
MTKLAVVVQRCHRGVVGGSETLAWEYARLLARHFDVEVLTTTATDYQRWDNVLPAGEEIHEGVLVRRYPVTLGGGGKCWSLLHAELIRRFENGDPPHDWTLALQEDWIRNQGPYSEPLLEHLDRRGCDYQAVLFITYLFPTTYFGLGVVPPERSFLAPTLHNEPAAYLPVYRHRAARVRGLLWLTEAEQRLGARLWGEVPGEVVAMPVATERAAPSSSSSPYLLYSGRIDALKGCDQLLDWFRAYRRSHGGSPLSFILTGQNLLKRPHERGVVYRGHVSEEEKASLMAGAAVFVMPSRYESFSLATLEAMAQGTPVLVNGACEVLGDHVTRSGGGRIYHDQTSFDAHLRELLRDRDLRMHLGECGRSYVLEHFQPDVVRARLLRILEGVRGRRAA